MKKNSGGRYAAAKRELDASIAIDSGFAAALSARAGMASADGDTITLNRIRNAMLRARVNP